MIKTGDMVRPKTRYKSSEEMEAAYKSKSLNYFPTVFEEYTRLLDSEQWFRVFDVSEKSDYNIPCLHVFLPSEEYFGDISYYFLVADMEKYVSPITEIL